MIAFAVSLKLKDHFVETQRAWPTTRKRKTARTFSLCLHSPYAGPHPIAQNSFFLNGVGITSTQDLGYHCYITWKGRFPPNFPHSIISQSYICERYLWTNFPLSMPQPEVLLRSFLETSVLLFYFYILFWRLRELHASPLLLYSVTLPTYSQSIDRTVRNKRRVPHSART